MQVDLIYPIIFIISGLVTYLIVDRIDNSFFNELHNRIIMSILVGIISIFTYYYGQMLLGDELLTGDFYATEII
jgi:hypothetical protein